MLGPYELFTEVVRCSFLGGKQVIDATNYTLEPTILRRYDFLRTAPEFGSKNGLNRLFTDVINPTFATTAKSELYRKDSGWIDRSYSENKVKQFKIGKDFFLVPILSKPTVGIDTSSTERDTFICFAFYDNYAAAYHYFEAILKIPKSLTHRPEFKWNKLNTSYRRLVDDELENILKMSCKCVIMIKTNALICPDEKIIDVYVKLIQGLFSNYNHLSSQRLALKSLLFKLSNEIPVHCDADFSPLSTDKIVKQFVKNLADSSDFTPLHAQKDSHESQPIQVTDILCGALKKHIIDKNRKFLQPWEFENKLKSSQQNKEAKCYLWKFA